MAGIFSLPLFIVVFIVAQGVRDEQILKLFFFCCIFHKMCLLPTLFRILVILDKKKNRIMKIHTLPQVTTDVAKYIRIEMYIEHLGIVLHVFM